MNSREDSLSSERTTPSLVPGSRRSAWRPPWLDNDRAVPRENLRPSESASARAELDCDPVNFAEMLKEEHLHRAQVRRLLWEFFD